MLHKARIIACAGSLMLLAACSSIMGPPSLEAQAEKLGEIMRQGGYETLAPLTVETSQLHWQYAGVELQASVTTPSATGIYPLIIYLPGLGEDAQAGKLWREHWAQAGYMVFSLQASGDALALEELQAATLGESNALAKSPRTQDEIDRMLPAADDEHTSQRRRAISETARNSELRYLGHSYFSTTNLQQRLHLLSGAFARFKQLAQSGQAPFAKADLSKVILAGYELGAQTAAAWAGEDFGVLRPSESALTPLAYLMLSPVVDLANGNLRTRFQKLQQPMLVVTSHQDDDPYAISSAAARTSLWEFAAPGMKYLLLLKDAGHRLLAGSELGDRYRQRGHARDGSDITDIFNNSRSRKSSMAQGSQRFSDIDTEDGHDIARQRQMLGYQQVAAILGVSTAFLDQLCKQQPSASRWLQDNANPWLGVAGVLKSR